LNDFKALHHKIEMVSDTEDIAVWLVTWNPAEYSKVFVEKELAAKI